jgi:hypothetical protein
LKNEPAPFAQADNFLHSFGSEFILSHRQRAKINERQRTSTKKVDGIRSPDPPALSCPDVAGRCRSLLFVV